MIEVGGKSFRELRFGDYQTLMINALGEWGEYVREQIGFSILTLNQEHIPKSEVLSKTIRLLLNVKPCESYLNEYSFRRVEPRNDYRTVKVIGGVTPPPIKPYLIDKSPSFHQLSGKDGFIFKNK